MNLIIHEFNLFRYANNVKHKKSRIISFVSIFFLSTDSFIGFFHGVMLIIFYILKIDRVMLADHE